MRNSQGTTLLFLAVALVLFFFSLSLLPAVELYCRFIRVAIALLILQVVVLGIRIPVRREPATSSLWIGTIVFAVLGIVFNAVLLLNAKC
jgi:hypothetical protein